MNTWPGGSRQAISQSDHEEWNSSNYPGTREICSKCDNPTGNCEEDNITDEEGLPYCLECAIQENICEGYL